MAAAVIAAVAWFLLVATRCTTCACAASRAASTSCSSRPASTIGESLIPFDSSESYWKAFAVGLVNTLRVAVVGIVLATVLGTLVGVGRFSRNLLVRGLCTAYVECFRNIPVLLQLLMWYLVLTEFLPGVGEAVEGGPLLPEQGRPQLPGADLEPGPGLDGRGPGRGTVAGMGVSPLGEAAVRSNRPAPQHVLGTAGHRGAGARWSGGRWAARPPRWTCPSRASSRWRTAARSRRNSWPCWLGLSLYTAAFIAEVVRSGIAAVPRGQSEAAAALGLDAPDGDAPGAAAAGTARHHPAADQPVPEPHQEFVARRGDRLSGRGVHREHVA